MTCNQGQVTNSCQNTSGNSSLVFVIVLYILLAIILGSWLTC